MKTKNLNNNRYMNINMKNIVHNNWIQKLAMEIYVTIII